MHKFIHLISILSSATLVLIALAACNDAEGLIDNGSNVPVSDKPISFTASEEWNTLTETRASSQSSFSKGDAIGVFAYLNNSTSPNFMNNQKVTFNGNDWTYEPVKYWPSNEKDGVDFYAYWPWCEDKSTYHLDVDASTSNGPILDYVSQNDDLDLLSASTSQQSYGMNAGAVLLSFKHQLARIKFRFRNDWVEKEDEYRLGINYLYISYESNSTLRYEYRSGKASYSTATTKQHQVQVINADEYYPYSSSEYHDITTPLYLVPNFIKNGTIELGIDAYQKVNGRWEKITVHSTPTYIVKATLPDKENLTSGTSLIYNISYKPNAGLTITMITEVDGWTEVDNDNKI